MDGSAGGAATYVTGSRYLNITSTLADGALLLTNMSGSDAVSTTFLFHIQFLTKLEDSSIVGLLGQAVTIYLCNTPELPGGKPLNGIVRSLNGPTPAQRGFKQWTAEIVPQLAFLGYTADCRIFQNMSVIQIIEKIFTVHNLLQYRIQNLSGSYPALDYCVQYRETALNFICRLMETVGLFFWHEHMASTHTLMIGDTINSATAAVADTLEMTDNNQFGSVFSLLSDYAFRPGKWTLKDFNFETPAAALTAATPTMIHKPAMADYEIFDYPGGFTDIGRGGTLSRVRIEREELEFHSYSGTSAVPFFDAGKQFPLEAPDPAHDGDYTEQNFYLLSVQHAAQDMTQIVNDAPPPSYSNSFSVIPTTGVMRPARVTPKPLVAGPQTAIVTGPSSQTIYTDEYGRVKVRFHWDRNPDADANEDSSCWLRVSQAWANNGWGAIQVPRIGEEVIVNFLDGDPDCPIITGRVYNGANAVPYALPANATQSGIKSQSTANDGSFGAGSNEFRFEDKLGSEEVWMHAQKDYNYKVENNETATIGGNETRNVTGNFQETISGTLTQTVSGDVSETYDSTLKQNVTTSITTTCPAVTFNVAAQWTLNVPNTTEAKNSDLSAGAYKLSAFGVGMNAYAVYLNVYALKMDITGLKIDLAMMAIKNAPVEFECVKAKIKVMDGWIKTAVTKVESAATYIKDGAMYAITYAVVMFP